MSLLTIAQADLKAILNDSVTGVGVTIGVRSPCGDVQSLTGWSNDIGLLVDPDTGQAVSGRIATVALVIADLTAAGLALPENISDDDANPWRITFSGLEFKVTESHPDRTLGVITCTLEAFDAWL